MSKQHVQYSIQKWHQMLKTRDLSLLDELLADDVVFRSPVAFHPYSSKPMVFFILSNVIEIFKNFEYHREFYTEDAMSVVLEFSADVDEKKLKGIDMIRFNPQGKIIDFEVMLRPKSGLEALAAHMGQRLAAFNSKNESI